MLLLRRPSLASMTQTDVQSSHIRVQTAANCPHRAHDRAIPRVLLAAKHDLSGSRPPPRRTSRSRHRRLRWNEPRAAQLSPQFGWNLDLRPSTDLIDFLRRARPAHDRRDRRVSPTELQCYSRQLDVMTTTDVE